MTTIRLPLSLLPQIDKAIARVVLTGAACPDTLLIEINKLGAVVEMQVYNSAQVVTVANDVAEQDVG